MNYTMTDFYKNVKAMRDCQKAGKDANLYFARIDKLLSNELSEIPRLSIKQINERLRKLGIDNNL